jgi:hypothetical protein
MLIPAQTPTVLSGVTAWAVMMSQNSVTSVQNQLGATIVVKQEVPNTRRVLERELRGSMPST